MMCVLVTFIDDSLKSPAMGWGKGKMLKGWLSRILPTEQNPFRQEVGRPILRMVSTDRLMGTRLALKIVGNKCFCGPYGRKSQYGEIGQKYGEKPRSDV